MSSATNMIGAVMPMLDNSTAATNIQSVAKVQNVKSSVSFDDILTKVTDTISTTPNQKTESPDTKQQVTSDYKAATDNSPDTSNTDVKATGDTKQTKQTTTTESKGTEANSMLQEAINEDGKKMIQDIAETLDVSVDEILNAMQILGLMAVDLLNPENLTQLVTTLGGQEKSLDLITDSDLYTSLQDLMKDADSMKSELMNEFDLSEDELKAAIGQAHEDFSQALKGQQEEKPDDSTRLKEEDLGTNTVKIDIREHRQNIEIHDDSKVTVQEFKPIEESQQTGKQNSNNNSGGFKQDHGPVNLFNQVINNILDNAGEVMSVQENFQYTDRAQMEDIIRQITDRITISKGPEETSMEMQLHPASLGNVNILLTSSKDGIIAKFTAQNEIVKEAVESQMIQLQQKFEEQGIKVTSVEVTIASHAFEQNLQQQDQNQTSQEEMAKSKKGLRRINLSEVEDITEDYDDDERLAAQMMAMNGNTVDFSA